MPVRVLSADKPAVRFRCVYALVVLCVLQGCCGAAEGEYDYNMNGADWPAKFPGCGGRSQSPIDLSASDVVPDPTLRPLRFSSTLSTGVVVRLSHTVQLTNFSGASTVTDPDGASYSLLQAHFHSASEHTFGSSLFDAEVHFVHQRVGGSALLVVAVALLAGSLTDDMSASGQLFGAIAAMSTNVNLTSVPATASFLVTDMLPPLSGYYRYSGSLTTPPCSEGVTFYVMSEPRMISVAQLAQLRSAMTLGTPGNRRVTQPLNGRTVAQFVVSPTSTAPMTALVVGAVALALVLLVLIIVVLLFLYVRTTIAASVPSSQEAPKHLSKS